MSVKVKRKKRGPVRKYQEGGIDNKYQTSSYDELKQTNQLKNKFLSKKKKVNLVNQITQDRRKKQNIEGTKFVNILNPAASPVKTDSQTGEKYRDKIYSKKEFTDYDKKRNKYLKQVQLQARNNPDKKDPYTGTVNPATGVTYTPEEAKKANYERQVKQTMNVFDSKNRNPRFDRTNKIKVTPLSESASSYSDQLNFTGDFKKGLTKEEMEKRKRRAVFNPKTGVYVEMIQRKSGIGFEKTGRTYTEDIYLKNKKLKEEEAKQKKQKKKQVKLNKKQKKKQIKNEVKTQTEEKRAIAKQAKEEGKKSYIYKGVEYKFSPKLMKKGGVTLKRKNENKVKRIYKKGGSTKDACYHKVVSRYGPKTSAYRSGAMAKCRKVGAANWGEGGKKKK